ncbi:Uncharacterised protein [Pseudomonas fragi]|uniref:Uncharacterized protein n=1 Tax=Pseudomonas fragi TaxID=296 RepID=A0A449IIZ2_PSEFR|nr:Uncharacterised protein [Pseudomonas fragi]
MALRVHIQHLCLTETMVSTLRRVPFGRTQKEPKGPRPIVRPSLRSGSLAPALLRGPAATGHPWPIAALPASMPVDPLRRTSSRPPGRAGRSKALRPEAADRPTGRPVRSIQKRPWPRCQTCCVVRPSGSDAVMGLLGVWNILLVEVVLLDKKQEQARRKPLQGNALAIKSEFTLRF